MSSVAIVICGLVFISQCTAQTLFKPPRIFQPASAKKEYVTNGANKTLSCQAEGTAPMMYTWKFNGNIISSDGKFIVDRNSGNMTILRFTDREEGDYQCYVENSVGNNISPVAVAPPINLLQVQPGGSWTTPGTTTLSGTEGDYLALKCNGAPKTVPEPKYSWYIDTQNTRTQIVQDERLYIDSKGTLHILSLKTTDETPGLYKCAIFILEKDNINLGSPTSLTVTPRTGVQQYSKPEIRSQTGDLTVLRTETAELECVFSGYELPSITWTFYNTPITAGDKYEFANDNRKLRIKNVQESDAGTYKCIGKNQQTVTGTNSLTVKSGPIWTEALSYETIPAGQDARFTCKAKSARNQNPPSEPVWFKNGVLMDITTPGTDINFREALTVLTVLKVQKPDNITCFQCSVTNDEGSEFDNACLNVIEPIEITKQPPERQVIHKGDTVDLTVQATTDPALTLKSLWRYKDQVYELPSLPPYVTHDPDNNVYYIDTESLTQEEYNNIGGVYYREFYHEYENKTVPCELVLNEQILALTQAGFPWWVIILLVVLIIIFIILALIIYCCCRNKDKGTYKIYTTELNKAYLDPDKDLEDNKFHDVARVENEEDPKSKKSKNLGPGFDMSGDENDSLDQYDGNLFSRSFNEDGSFIGQYATKESQDI